MRQQKLRPVVLPGMAVPDDTARRFPGLAWNQRVVNDQIERLHWQCIVDHLEQGSCQSWRPDAAAFQKFVIGRPVTAFGNGTDRADHPTFWRNQTATQQFDESGTSAQRHGAE
ncbi:hypothetical protein [Nitrosomonas sp.]|uniref:hypothetical protein n=1 Tax=Nitrosomonas sp. TaxID=42353 RepID=UPI003453FA6D